MANAAGEYMKNRAQCVITPTLDLRAYLEDEDITRDQSAIYELAGAVLHTGPTIDSGHYIVHTRNKVGDYFWLDDVASPRVTQSSIHRINNDIGFDVVLVAYVKLHNDDSKEQDAAMQQIIADYLRDRTAVTTEIGELYSADSGTIKLADEAPAPVTTSKQEYPKPEPLKLDLLKQDRPVHGSPHQDLLKPDPPKPDYRSMDEKQLKSLMQQLGLKLDNKKRPVGCYIDIFVRDDANDTTYDEYTVDQLKGEIIRRGLNPIGINTRATATKELERDDNKKGFKKPSFCSINQALQTDDKTRNSELVPQKLDKKKPSRRPGRKTPIEMPPKKLTKKPAQKPENDKLSKQDGKNNRNVGEDAAEESATKNLDMGPLLAPKTHSVRFTSSTTLQIFGKGCKGGPKPLTHTWSLPATYDPNFDLDVIARLTIAAPDYQKPRFPIDVASERHRFHLDSSTSVNKKRKAAPPGADDDETPSPKKPSPPRIDPNNDAEQTPTKQRSTASLSSQLR